MRRQVAIVGGGPGGCAQTVFLPREGIAPVIRPYAHQGSASDPSYSCHIERFTGPGCMCTLDEYTDTLWNVR